MSKIITKAVAVILAAGALTTVAGTGKASAGYDGWHRGYDHERRFDYDRDFNRWDYRHQFSFRWFRSY
jgi:hypothetical protein